MKKTTSMLPKLSAVAAATLCATSAMAQSSVTLYGLADTAIRYQTNAGVNGTNQTQLGVGVETPSRWGLKGSEDLGGGLSAIFRLENGFNLWDGALSSSGVQFSRMAYIGLSSKDYGTLTFGRQQSPFFSAMGNLFDPLTVGDYWQDSWVYNGVGPFLTINNSVKYAKDFGGLHIEGMYGFGNQAGAVGLGSMYGVEASYAFGPATFGAGFQQNDVASAPINGQPPAATNGAKFNILHVSATYKITPAVNLLAGWLHSHDRTGLTDFNMQQAQAPTLPGTGSPNRIDDSFYVGAAWQATTPLSITLAGYYDHARNAERLDGTLGTGINYSATLLGEYSLSKRTEVYGTVDFARGNGAFAADYPGSSIPGSTSLTAGRTNNVGVAIGLRNIF
ncbi:porin [Paraburkholderia sp.]|uniref:porin n=1 Tax=Paraburkholderia sp. TaxID=1926495 RepID=UPI003C79F375